MPRIIQDIPITGTLHQFLKVNHSRLAFFITESCVFAGVSAETCGLHDAAWSPAQGPIPLSPAPSSLAPSCVKNLKSASTGISLVTNPWVTRGLFMRLDGVIAYPGETALDGYPSARIERRYNTSVLDTPNYGLCGGRSKSSIMLHTDGTDQRFSPGCMTARITCQVDSREMGGLCFPLNGWFSSCGYVQAAIFHSISPCLFPLC